MSNEVDRVRACVGENMRVWRTGQGVTAKDLSGRLGANLYYVSRTENGKHTISVPFLLKLSVMQREADCPQEDNVLAALRWRSSLGAVAESVEKDGMDPALCELGRWISRALVERRRSPRWLARVTDLELGQVGAFLTGMVVMDGVCITRIINALNLTDRELDALTASVKPYVKD